MSAQVKELNASLETEKASRTDLEMYVAVLNTQKNVLTEDADKLRTQLQEGACVCEGVRVWRGRCVRVSVEVCVLNTQKNVLTEDADKLRTQLQEGACVCEGVRVWRGEVCVCACVWRVVRVRG